MTQEEKDLLKDLCARLPYGFKYQVQYGDTSVRDVKKFILDGEYSLFDTWMVHEIKPYLRPMSSMTEEERKELAEKGIYIDDDFDICYDAYEDRNISLKYVVSEYVDWLNAHHFDYRGLIPMGLALPAPEGMYNI